MNNDKTVYSFDYASRGYRGPVQLNATDRDPLTPGKFQIPGDCTETPPPPYDEQTHLPYWVGENWEVRELPPPPEPEPEPEPLPHDQLVNLVRNQAKAMVMSFLPLLTSMQVDAMADGTEIIWGDPPAPTALAVVIKDFKNQLQGIPEGVNLSSCVTLKDMENAMQAAYVALVAQAPQEIRVPFSAMVPR
ncbi:MAG: hypothetical protein ACK4F4_07295 [Hylemonella sp.]|uniref:hypothetical protein n=1 Tax=Hylemonella sp. TaxID=2066020 RepID=UPI0039190CC1